MHFTTPLLIAAALVSNAAGQQQIVSTGTKTVNKLPPYNVASPGATPQYTARAAAVFAPVTSLLSLIGAVDFPADSDLGRAVAAAKVLREKRDLKVTQQRLMRQSKRQLLGLNLGLGGVLGGVLGGASSSSTVAAATAAQPATSSAAASSTTTTTTTAPTTTTSTAAAPVSTITCLDSTNTESQVNSLLSAGGAGTTVYLCPNAVLSLANPIQFNNLNQTLITRGAPTDSTRAILRVTGAYQSNAVTSSCDSCSYCSLRNVQVDGARPALGYISGSFGGSGLLEFGGSTTGQVIDNVKAYEPRSWTALHGIEGTSNSCSGLTISNNQIGPSGHGPSGAAQQRKRDTGSYPTGQWADGISMACQGSTVKGNTITDATDGAIVVFGAPGSTITGNTIVAVSRNVMGGVNMVDYNPFSGSFKGTVVKGNTFNAQSAMIKNGVAIGVMVWGSDNTTAHTADGQVLNNVFTSGSSGYFGYGVSVAGHDRSTVSGSVFQNANFAGIPSSSCTSYLPPTPGPLYVDPTTTPASSLSASFSKYTLEFLICMGPTATMSQMSYSASS